VFPDAGGTIQEQDRRHETALCCAGAGSGAGRRGHVPVRRMRTHRGATAKRPDTRTWAQADRQRARPGTAVAVPIVLRQGAGHGLDQVEGDELNPQMARRYDEIGVAPS
jgi:hypothetical protein